MKKAILPRPVGLKAEFLTNPNGLPTATPRLSWRLEDTRLAAAQTAYRITAAATLENLLAGKSLLWDTKKVPSDKQLDIVWAGKRLGSRAQVFWRVLLWDKDGKETDWSEPASFDISLLSPKDWSAKWIGIPDDRNIPGRPSPMFRKEFELASAPVRARLYASACGVMNLSINGKPASPELFAPGWTDYRKRLQFVAYDVTDLLSEGPNALGAVLGDGWWSGRLGWGNNRCRGGNQLALLAQLEVTLADGSAVTVVTDDSWFASDNGPVRSSDFYDGEKYDARLDRPGWDAPGFDNLGWFFPTVLPAPKCELVPRVGVGCRRQQLLSAKTRTEPAKGVYIFDLGQNMVGHIYLELQGKTGGTIKVRYAEMLNKDGTMYTANYRAAKSTDYYICQGPGEGKDKGEIFETVFASHGFRYVELSGDFAVAPKCEDLSGVVVHSEIPKTGSFECSDPLVNRLYSNITWGQRGNYIEVPTDCPQRDERLGWTGDAQIFVRTGAFNCDVASFFSKWEQDLVDSQTKKGAFPDVAPTIFGDGDGHSAWGDAGVICPWTMYLHYGDTEILRKHYDAMAAWVQYYADTSDDYIPRNWTYGDWIAIDCAQNEWGNIDCGRAPTPCDLINTAYFAKCAAILADVAKILGKAADSRKYLALRKKVEEAFRRTFVTEAGRVVGDAQTGYLLALGFDLVTEPKLVKKLVDRLVDRVVSRGTQLTTGFVGTPLLCPVLTRFGHSDLAYKLLLRKEYPSWLFPIVDGDATTMWERWNSYTSKRGFGDVGMNSFNHYAYGAVGEWMYSALAGLDFAEPGFKKIRFAPVPTTEFTSASFSLETRYGLASIAWKRKGSKLTLHLVVPANTTAVLELPGQESVEFPAGKFKVEAKI